MTKQLNLARIAVILLFAMTFTLVGWTSPVIYASHVPADQVIEVHDFTAEDTTTESDEHYVCFDRTVATGSPATIYTELYLLDKNDNRVEVDSNSMDRYMQEGRTTVIVPYDLPDGLQAGEYRYVLVTEMEMADGRVTRNFMSKSEPFVVEEGQATNVTRPTTC